MTRAPLLGLLVASLVAGCAERPEGAPQNPAPTPPRAPTAASAAAPPTTQGVLVLDQAFKLLDGTPTSLAAYRGKAVLLVNTASACGYTPQYAGLEKLHETYKDRGLVVLGFPCNDFGAQEPGSASEIKAFCETKFHVTFPLAEKVHAKGAEKHPIYKALTEDAPAPIKGEVKWNFTKFLIDPKGAVVARFEPGTEPLAPELVAAIEKALPAK
jgi:glutathione peroxidase